MKKIASTAALLSAEGHQYLDEQVTAIKANHGVATMGRSVLIRGIVDALAQAGVSLSDCTNDFAVAARVRSLLTEVKA